MNTKTVRALLALVLLALCLATSAEDAVEGEAVAFATTTVEGEAFDLEAHREGWVAVNFWATWCKPCRKEIPDLDSLHRERQDVTVLGLAFEEVPPAEVIAFLEDYDASYPIAMVDVYDPPGAFGVPRVLPTTVMVDPQGRVAKTFVGPVTSEEIKAYIDGEGAP
ncbi:MAG: TlpA disulfide reductase family protein [Pseudomonadota bacterium]